MSKLLTICFILCAATSFAQTSTFNGLDMSLSNLSRLSDAQTRSISPENFTGEKGKGGMADPIKQKGQRNVANAANEADELGVGWKVNPFIIINPGETFTIAEMEGPGAIQHIWMTPTGNWQFSIIRFYWDDETTPSIEAPVGAFFGMAWNEYAHLNSLAVTVNPGSAFNCYWKMPFRKKCKITVENINPEEPMRLYYQVTYALTEIGDDEAYLHAQYRRSNPNSTSVHTILDGVRGKGHYVGTYMGVGVRNNGWWGEGEIKFYLDGDKDFATIVGTGTEDYFCGSYNFENRATKQYQEFSTAYAGLHQVIRPDGMYRSQQRFGLYRWHIQDPIRFEKDLKVTIQDLGWRQGGYLAQQSDIITVAFWYQREPHARFPKLPDRKALEIN
ncbi:MAG TPA: glycoside hydrolase family 172 protein [Cyclobacteriaceae bacterium]|nr:glycoside hydrolase family 172 protein [Cyclobacteriaceae bacterium]